MKTISTLCATSTVGIAACGFALATPQSDTRPSKDHLTAVSSNAPHNNLLRDPCGALLGGLPRGDSQQSCLSPAVPASASAVRRPLTSRSWFQRLSGSISSSSVASSPPSSTHSSIVSSSRSRPASSSRPSSRPPTRNKLVKRSRSQRLSTSNRHSAPSPQRPSTGVHQSSPAGQPSNLTPIHASRLSSSHQEPTYLRPYDPKPVDSWRVFFTAKRQRIKHTPSPSGTKLTKLGGVKRIYPDFVRRRQGPTLVLAPVVSADPSDNADSVCSGRDSLYFESRPTTSQMGETQHQGGRHRPSASATSPTSSRRHVRRSFSISNLLAVSAPRRSSSQSRGEDDDDSVSSGFVGLCPMNMTFGRRYSTPTDSHSSFQRSSGPATPLPVEEEREQPPPIQSLSVLELNLESVPANNYSAHVDDHLEGFVAANHNAPQPNMQYPSNIPRTHRLSLMSTSERASTLIGSEDLNHFDTDFDFQSETVFDSMRTKASEQTPIRADSIFDMTGPPPLDLNQTQPMDPKYGHKSYSEDDDYTPRVVEKLASSPNTSRLTAQFQATKTYDDDDDDAWSSDWDVPSKSIDGDPHNRLSIPGGLRPYGGMSLGMNTSNASRTTFDTAREGLSNDGSSIRETGSILDWNEGIPTVVTSSSPGFRPKTVHAKESILTTSRAGRRVSSYHVRSQSMPLANSSHERVPLPSENWDDDFLDDDDDDGMGLGNNVIIIPRAIEERQASVLGHLGHVREFALLVEDLKRLRLMGTAMGMRDGPYKLLWEEADAVIALANLRDEKELGPPKEKLRTRDANRPSSIDDREGRESRECRENREARENRKSCPLPTRRSSVLLADDNIFGGSAPATHGAPIIHQLKHSHRSCPLPSTSVPQGKKKPLRGSAADAIKNMMERLRKQASRSSLSSTTSTSTTCGKFEFDTGMLSDLVIRVTELRKELTALVEQESPNNSAEKMLGSKAGMIERDKESSFDLDLSSPVKSTFEDTYGTGIERVRSGGMDFRSVVGVA